MPPISAEERQYVDPVEFRQYVDPVEFREIHPSQATFGETNIYRVLEETSADQEERITSYPLTLHGGPVMATPSNNLYFKFVVRIYLPGAICLVLKEVLVVQFALSHGQNVSPNLV